jgi:hypothetical protein
MPIQDLVVFKFLPVAELGIAHRGLDLSKLNLLQQVAVVVGTGRVAVLEDTLNE